ncbi:alpha/beta fold hydrolase [Streptomyces sp. NPDC005931]|uniref:alpha/beta fold hydrolase n=1 Tax=Streptomyces sp. NPDC005931 TaxID=3364737 RepID=UPI0036AB9CD1
MRGIRAGGTALAVLGAVGVAAARAAADRIARNPDPYALDRLAREPEGEEVFIPRPDGTVLRALVAGEGPAVVLAHGYGASLLEWNLIWEELRSAGHRVIAFDQRGHERSTLGRDGVGSGPMSADYAAVLEHFDVTDGVLVGHSMGGFLAIRAVLDHREVVRRLRGLVLVATWAGRIYDGAPQNRLQIPLIRAGIIQRWMRTRTGALLFGAAQCGSRPSPAMISVYRDVFLRQDHPPLLPVVRAFASEDRYPRLGEITVPTVVVVGADDRSTPPLHAQRMAGGIRGARLVTVPGAGHMINWEGADALVEAVESVAAPTRDGSGS